jgi:hypothetical protein
VDVELVRLEPSDAEIRAGNTARNVGLDPIEDLREQATKYSFEAEIDALLRYLETEGEVNDDRFPEWDEFQQFSRRSLRPQVVRDQ